MGNTSDGVGAMFILVKSLRPGRLLRFQIIHIVDYTHKTFGKAM